MAFRMKVAQSPLSDQKISPSNKRYTQDDIDLIDANYQEKEKKFLKFTQPANPLLDEYRKSLKNDNLPKTEKIIFDPISKKWILEST